jgi:hypothetical protein
VEGGQIIDSGVQRIPRRILHGLNSQSFHFRCMFSRNRYQNILNFLHLVDKKKIPKRNDLSYKPSLRFKPLIDFVNRKFLPRRELSVDESLVGTKGKTSMLQYIPSKRSRFGVKFWMLIESVTGYVLHMTVYQIKVITKLPNSEQSYKGKVKTHNYINRQNQSTTGKL